MASLLERLNVVPTSTAGPVRTKSNNASRSSTPYQNRAKRVPKGDPDSTWTHDLYESHNSLSARISDKPTAHKANLNPIAQKALKDATAPTREQQQQLSIKGASSLSQGNVIEVSGLVGGTTAEDVAAIFKRCGAIVNAKAMPASSEEGVRIRVTFKAPSSAAQAVQKFHNQPADGKIISVKIVGSTSAGTTLGGRLGADGLGLVREEGSVDVLIDSGENKGSKLRSDSLLHADPRAQVLVAPPGADAAEYTRSSRGGRGGGRGRGRRGRGRGAEGRMDID